MALVLLSCSTTKKKDSTENYKMARVNFFKARTTAHFFWRRGYILYTFDYIYMGTAILFIMTLGSNSTPTTH